MGGRRNMIRGIVYLTGLVTLTVVGVVAAFAFKVHKWPWKEYIQTGRREIVETLDPQDPVGRDDEMAARGRLQDGRAGRSHGVAGRPGEAGRRGEVGGPAVSEAPVHVEARPRPPRPRTVHKPRVPLVRRHVVRKDETLYAIASRFYGAGERWPEIARANDIRKPSDLRVGRAIVVPYDTVAFEDRTDGVWVPDLSLRFAPAAGTAAPSKDRQDTQDSGRRLPGNRVKAVHPCLETTR